jgi:TolB-like protein
MGDGVLIEFASAIGAVEAAREIQRRLAEANAATNDETPILVRIGINLGDVIGEGADIYGDGVNIAARLEALAEPGGIVVSAKVHEEVAGKVEAAFADLGEQQLKNLARPVRAYRISGTVPAKTASAIMPARPELISVAVLPFTNMSGDASQEYFADGLTEDLITALAKSRHLHVLSRNATFEFKGRVANIPEVGRQLGARYVLEGSVRTGGNRVRVTAQLIDAATGGHVWAERFDRELADIFAVQDEIVGAIAGRLAQGLVDAAVSSSRNKPTDSLTAYDRLLRGRASWRRGFAADAREHWTKAVEADPLYAPALAGLSFVYAYDVFTQLIGEPVASLRRWALQFAERAVISDNEDFFTHHCVGSTFCALGELDRARHHLETAVALNPFLPNSIIMLGFTIICMGDHEMGLRVLERGFVMEPRLSPATSGAEAEAHLIMGNFDAARSAFNRIENPFAFQFLLHAVALVQAGQSHAAAQALDEFHARRTPWFDVPGLVASELAQLRLPEDRARLFNGFRKLGIDV